MLREIVEEHSIVEGEMWDMVKGTAQLLKIMNWAKKEVVKRLEKAKKEGKSPDEMVETFKSIMVDVKDKINGTSLPEDMKRSSIENFRNGIIKGLKKRMKAK
jgi:hypothetical protein